MQKASGGNNTLSALFQNIIYSKNKNFEQIVIPNKTTHQDKSRSKINIEEIIKRRQINSPIIKENKKS